MRNELTAISPIDGRYASKTQSLTDLHSEFALIKYRVRVEIEYFIAISGQVPQVEPIQDQQIDLLRSISNT